MNYWDNVAEQIAPQLLELFEDWYGAQAALKRRHLCQTLECSDSVLRAAIGLLRRQGHLVIADPEAGGYRLAQSVDEVEQYIDTLTRQVEALQEIITAMEAALAMREVPWEQHSLFE